MPSKSTILSERLYNRGSLRNSEAGVVFSIRNRLAPGILTRVEKISVNGEEIDLAKVMLAFDNDSEQRATDLREVKFPLGTLMTIRLETPPLRESTQSIVIQLNTEPAGPLKIEIKDHPRFESWDAGAIPRQIEDDYAPAIVEARRRFILERTGVELKHVSAYSFAPRLTKGNIEQFTGVAQVPLGFAGPLLMTGENAQGEFYVPLATTEGTLVASYNRGMKVIRKSGGVHCTVVEDHMQRAPGFAFESATDARKFLNWLSKHEGKVRAVADATDPFVQLESIDCYQASRFTFARFNFLTGDAAGQNMVGKATLAACNWILQACDAVEIRCFYLESNLATDKKPSMMNTLRTRGKRVIAEATIRSAELLNVMNVDAETLHHFSGVAGLGAALSGANNNGCHSSNAITAIFIATGQDVANVSEASAAMLYTELTPEKDLYVSLTLPSLIVATCGGGTGLPTQRECLESLDCYGEGRALKFAEIVAGTALAGELSLGAAIASLDWVASHEYMGRNAPNAIVPG